MAIGNDQAKVKVDLDTQQAENKIKELSAKAKELRRDIKKALESGSNEGASVLKKELNLVEKEIDQVRRSVDQVSRVMKNLNGSSLKDLTKAQIQLTMSIRNSSRATYEERIELDKKAKQLKLIKAQIRDLNQQYYDITQTKWTDRFANFFNKYSQGLLMVAGMGGGVAYSMAQFLKNSGQVADELARIQKTTEMTTSEVNNLNNAFKKMDTRTSVSDLRQIAIIGGQLGIAKNDILGFTKSIDMLSVALGDEFKGGSEEIANTLGKLRNVLTDRRTANVGDDLLKIGNALNVLGAEGMATGDVVSDFANRIGGIGIPLGMTTPQVLGLSASLQEMGVSTERGATAVVKILQKMSKETETFAKIAGMPFEEFYQLVNTNITEAFLRVAQGAKNSGREATSLAEIIKELEIQGAGASEVFAKVGSNLDLVRDKINTSSDAIRSTTSITREYNIMNETLGAKLEKLSKDFNRLMTSEFIQNFAKRLTEAMIALVNWLKNLPDLYDKYRVSISAVMTVITAYIAVNKKAFLIRMMNNLALKEGIGLKIKEVTWDKASALWKEISTIWTTKQTLATRGAAIATAIWNATLAANPIGWVVLAIGALITAYKAYEKYNARAVELEEKKISTLYKTKNLIDQTKDVYQKLSGNVEKFVTLSKKERDAIVETTKARLADLKAQMSDQKLKRQGIYSGVYNETLQKEKYNFYKGTTGNFSEATVKNAEKKWSERATEKALEAVKDIDEANAELQTAISEIEGEYSKISNILNAEQLGDQLGSENSSMLQKKLEYYKQALGILTIGTEDYRRVVLKIQETQKLLDKYNIDFSQEGNEKSAKEKVTQLEKYLKFVEDTYQKIEERIREHNRNVEQLHMEATAREIDQIRQKYEKDIEKVQGITAFLSANPANMAKIIKWQKAYADLVVAMNKEITAKEEEQAKELEAKKAEIRKKYNLLALDEQMNIELTELQKYYDGGLIRYDDYMKKRDEIRRKYAAENLRATTDPKYSFKEKFGILSDDELQQKEMTELDATAIQDGTISTEELEAAKEKIREKYRKLRQERDEAALKTRLEQINTELERARYMIQTLGDFFTSMKDMELAKAGDNEEKKKQIMKKYADIDLAITISNIIANTAGAIMKAAEQLGVFAPPFQVVLGATGAMQIAAATAERNKIQSLETGGYTGSGIGMTDADGKEIAGIVHPNEYVIPAWERQIPLVANFERIIEAIRTNRGFQQGGTTTREIIKSEPVYMGDEDLKNTINRLYNLLSNGIQAKLVANERYLKTHNEAQQKLSDIKSQSTR